MTRQQFIDQFKHEVAGFVVDAATAGRTGAELAVWLRNTMQKIDAKLGVMYDAVTPEEKPATNGVHPKPANPPPPAAYPRRA